MRERDSGSSTMEIAAKNSFDLQKLRIIGE